MVSSEEYNYLSPNDQNTILSFWHCPYDNIMLEKATGRDAGVLDIRRGKSDISLNNAVNMKRIPEKERDNVNAVIQLSFQLLSGEYQSFTHVKCPKEDYTGYAPQLPFLLQSNQHNEQLIQKLLDDSSKYQRKVSQENRGGGGGLGGRRFPIFGIFILMMLLPLLALASFLGWAILYTILAF